jgi:uncharacterized protein
MSSALGLAVVIGIAFGAALEQAGLGSARKLAGQFYLTDFTVFKVMFSAVLTALLGTFWLGRAGWIELSALYVPETFLMPQLIGGLVFGLGFVISGLCPGTCCVAAANGRGDGVAAMLGLFIGMLLCGLAYQWLEPFYLSTVYGTWTLPQLLHLPYGVVVCGIVMMALLAFQLLARLERRA